MPIEQIVLLVLVGCLILFYGLRPILTKLIEDKKNKKKNKEDKNEEDKKE